MAFVGDNAIDVETSTLVDAATTITTELNTISQVIDTVTKAGNDAVAACGGEGTAVGGALKTNLVEIDKTAFNTVSASLTDLAAALSKVANEYDAEEAELLRVIQAHSPSSVGSVGGGGGTGAGVSSAAVM